MYNHTKLQVKHSYVAQFEVHVGTHLVCLYNIKLRHHKLYVTCTLYRTYLIIYIYLMQTNVHMCKYVHLSA